MSTVDPKDLAAFAEQADAWFAQNVVRDPGFMLPLTFMEVGTDTQFHFLRDWQNKVWEAGYLGAAWPKAYGGGGLPQAFQNAATRAMRKHHGPIMLNAIGLNWAGPLILEMGSEAQKAAYLKGILSAEDIWCQGFSEPGHGSDLGSAQTRAVRNGDHYVVNGSKIWTTLGRYARYMILLARTDPSTERKYDGLSFFLMPMKAPGIETVPIRKLTGEHGFTQTFFTDARAPADGLVGNAFDVFDLAQRTTRGGRPVLEDPLVADEMVGFLMEIQALTLNGQRTQVPELVADRPQGIPLASKLMGTEMSRRLNDFAVRLTGARGAYYVDEPEAADNGLWARNYLNAFSATIGGGTSQIQANIVGEHVLGLPKS